MGSSRLRGAFVLLVLALGGVASLALLSGRAEACAGFFAGTSTPEKNPSLSRERVLLIHDCQAGQEHFIRELVFRGASRTFGFVVPTPTRPEVAKFDGNPFPLLESGFARTKDELETLMLGAAGGQVPAATVRVLETSSVGSFTAFVLQASDAGAFAKWLSDQGLEQGPNTASWLAHYVGMSFYFVALRYEPPGVAPGAPATTSATDVVAETVRISFPTPVAYYPYFEPPTLAAIAGVSRDLELWVVGSEPLRPVALERRGVARTWVEPFAPVETHVRARGRLVASVPSVAPFLPQGELFVQTFSERSWSREGLGDVLFATVHPSAPSAAERTRMQPLLAVLDPELLPAVSKTP